MVVAEPRIADVEAWNDSLAIEHPSDDYYDRSGFLIRFVEQRRLSLIQRMVNVRPNERVLEVGCGGGHVLRLFPHAELTGVDVSGVFLESARRNLRGYRATLLHGSLSDVALPECAFPKVICTEVLEHTIDPHEVLAQIKRVTAPGGTVVITLPNDHLIQRIKGVIRRTGSGRLPPFRRISWGGDKYHLHRWTRPQMRGMIVAHFSIVAEAAAPTGLLPLRCCFKCIKHS